MSTRLSDALKRIMPPGGVMPAGPAPYEQSDEYRAVMETIRDSKLRRAGLRGAYAEADSSMGREAYGRALAGRGTYLHGLPGRGKTFAASGAVRMAVLDGRTARIVTAKALLDEVKAEYGGDGSGALERAARYWLLALDDLGMERPTEWVMETLTGLVDARVADGLPTIVTSNYSLGELRERWGGLPGMRIASRLAGACERVEAYGPDRRWQCDGDQDL